MVTYSPAYELSAMNCSYVSAFSLGYILTKAKGKSSSPSLIPSPSVSGLLGSVIIPYEPPVSSSRSANQSPSVSMFAGLVLYL